MKIRGLAQKQKMTLNEWGLYEIAKYEKAKKETAKPPQLKPVASESEESIYAALGLAYIEPEMREDFGEVELAKANKLPKLITVKDIRGDLHTHTNASDGRNTIEEMAAAAKAAGYEYLGVTDHSKAMAMARGLTVDRFGGSITGREPPNFSETPRESLFSPARRWTSWWMGGWIMRMTC